MVGLIELQQGLSHSTLAEKINQEKHENLNIYQQYTAAELKEKDFKKQKQINKTYHSDDVRIKDKEKKQNKNKFKKRINQNVDASDTPEQPEHKLDILV